MDDRLETLRLAAVRRDEAVEAKWAAERTLAAAERLLERALAEHAEALEAVSRQTVES